MGDALELRDPLGDLLAGQSRDPLDAEFLDIEGRQRRAVRHRAAQQVVLQRAFGMRRDVTHEAAREAIPRAGRVYDVLEREGGQPEEALVGHHRGAVLPLLGDDHARAPFAYLPGGSHQVGLTGELAQLGVVEHQAVDLRDRLDQRVARGLDPQVHRVERDKPCVRALLSDVALEVGLNVGQEEHVRGSRSLRQLRAEVREDVELCVERGPLVQVPAVLASPEERASPRHLLDVIRVHAAVPEHRVLLCSEVVAHRSHHVDIVEERCGQREVHGGATEHPLATAERRLDRVERDRAYDRQRHEAAQVSGERGAGVAALLRP